MTARTDQLGLFDFPIRWLLVPFGAFAVVATALEVLKRRARTPRVGPVSEQWLREHAARDSDQV